jgi:mutual gliding-motility protein MglA
MPTIHHSRREVFIKVVYYGPGLGGKTSNIKHLHDRAKKEHRGKLLSLESAEERTLFFDLMPVELGKFRGYDIRLHLCTVPGQVAYDATRKMILRNTDAVVFVADSQPEQLEANITSLHNLDINLRLQGTNPRRLPLAVQYNKRDLPGVMSTTELSQWLSVPPGVPEIPASATLGDGVLRTLKETVRQVLRLVGEPSAHAQGRFEALLPEPRLSLFPSTPLSESYAFHGLFAARTNPDEFAGVEFTPAPDVDGVDAQWPIGESLPDLTTGWHGEQR